MYSTYSQFQQLQLSTQPYQDTQRTWLAVYAPGRCASLAASLELQLHRKFQLTQSLDGLPQGVDGVVVAAEDAECLSTTLSYFAAALQSGADLAFCDAVFGFEGDTVVYRAAGRPEGCRCAVLSRALLERCRARAKDPDCPAALLELAFRLAGQPVHISQALLRYRRPPCAEDLFSPRGKRALLLSHVLDMTGAPIVLVSAVPVLRRMGYEVAVLGPGDGGSLSLFVEAGATAVTHPDCVSSSALWGLATAADLVIANTIVEVKAIRALSGGPVPVLWWLHDAFVGYGYLSHLIPRELGPNIRVCAVGSHATAAMHAHRPGFEIGQLIYGLPDYAQDTFEPYDTGYAGGLPLFVSVGAFESRKGQDILVDAIRLLPGEVRSRAAFLFVGKGADKRLLAQVQPGRPHAHLCHRGADLRQAGHRLGAHRHRRPHHRGGGRLCLPRGQPRRPGRGHDQADRPPGAGRPDGPGLPGPLRAVLFQAVLCRHPPGPGGGPPAAGAARAGHLLTRPGRFDPTANKKTGTRVVKPGGPSFALPFEARAAQTKPARRPRRNGDKRENGMEEFSYH